MQFFTILFFHNHNNNLVKDTLVNQLSEKQTSNTTAWRSPDF